MSYALNVKPITVTPPLQLIDQCFLKLRTQEIIKNFYNEKNVLLRLFSSL